MSTKLPSFRFRKQLKTELPILESEGLLSAEQSAAIRRRYQLDELASQAARTLLMVIYLIGATLVGIGIVSFVAAHWTDLSRELKLTLILGAMLAAHISGFVLWKVHGRFPKLGHTLVLLGTLIFGANIGLVAQIFHVRDNPYNGFAAWTLGAAAVAWAVKSVPNAMLALITAAIFGFGNLGNRSSVQLAWFTPAALVVFVPLIVYLRSTWVLWGTLLVVGFLGPMCTANLLHYSHSEYAYAASASLMGLVFFCAGLAAWKSRTFRFAAVPCWTMGLFWGTLAVFLASFMDYSTEMVSGAAGILGVFVQPIVLITFCVLIASAVGLAVYAGTVLKSRLAVMLLVLSAAAFGATAFLPQLCRFEFVLLACHLILILLIAVLFYGSFLLEDRRVFWAAVLLAAVLISARTLEYETGLLIKAAVFTGCGIGLIAAGVFFECYLRNRRCAHD
jgi:uncharacterized membrane protein